MTRRPVVYDLHDGFEPYVDMCRQFIRGDITGSQLFRMYYAQFLAEPTGHLCGPVFHHIEWFLLSPLDDYCADETLIEPDKPGGGITGAQLREKTIEMLREAGYDPFERPSRRFPSGEEPIRKSRQSSRR